MRIVHLSDIHVWRLSYNPARLASKRAVGVFELMAGRARKFRLERLSEVVDRVQAVRPDHVLITGDLSTTALPAEFRGAREALAPLLTDSTRATVIPGNHDRYTTRAYRSRIFETYFGDFAGASFYPWLKELNPETAILGLDPTRSHISARGFMPPEQIDAARMLVGKPDSTHRRLIVACHYPLAAPPIYEAELEAKKIKNVEEVRGFAAEIQPHVFCCGHVHAAWAFIPPGLPNQLCLNSGAPLMRDKTGFRMPGFLEIILDGPSVTVQHHAWTGVDWLVVPMVTLPAFFQQEAVASV